ncbi:MAG TPA: GNAT family N-acetyltransferase [Methylomirabilota bacterium]|nr:GNAT family N-acetyltransferase [Methylomirabilota bacterium]
MEEIDTGRPATVPSGEATRPAVREIVCRDGARVRLRPIRPDDAPRLIAFHDRLSRQTVYQRFFVVVRRLSPDWAQRLTEVDHQRRVALVIETGPPENPTLIAVARYEPSGEPGIVEVAFVVEDEWQGRGLGTVLFDELLRAAAARGFARFRAYVLADNGRMLDMITRFGTVLGRKLDGGVVTVDFVRPAGEGSA